jgi:hypothetical protein
MIDLILLAIFSYALYRMAESYNITPWRWITRYVLAFFGSTIALVIVLISIYGEGMMRDAAAMQKISLAAEPFILLYQFVLFFFFRTRIVRYVHDLDQIDKDNNNHSGPRFPDAPGKDKKEKQDFSYFR